MGILAHITNSVKSTANNSTLASGGHAINKDVVLAPTDPTAINPMNAGTWQTVRTAPVNTTPQYFTREEANALKNLAKECTDGARQSQRAYNALKKIEEADAKVHRHHRRYIRGVAEAELNKKRSDVQTAKHLHGQRPQYAKLGIGLETSENKATARIAELKDKIKDKY